MPGIPLDISRLNDPKSLENGLVMTATTSALTLVDPRRIGVGGRLAYRGALAAITGWATWTAVQSEDESPVPFSAKFGVVTSAVGITLAFAEAGEALDSKLHDALTRAGVRKPRLVMAAMTAILGFVAWQAGRHLDENQQPFIQFDDDVTEPDTEVPYMDDRN